MDVYTLMVQSAEALKTMSLNLASAHTGPCGQAGNTPQLKVSSLPCGQQRSPGTCRGAADPSLGERRGRGVHPFMFIQTTVVVAATCMRLRPRVHAWISVETGAKGARMDQCRD